MGGVSSQLLMLTPKMLKSKKKFYKGLAENFLSFQAKKCLGMVLDFEYQVAPYTKYTRTTNIRRHFVLAAKKIWQSYYIDDENNHFSCFVQ